MKEKPDILIFAPTPPPYAGPEVSTHILLDAMTENKVNITHVRSNIRDENWKKGNFDLEGIWAFIRIYARLLKEIFSIRPDKIYFLLSSNNVGFLRDAVIILTAKFFGIKTVGHYRGGNFLNFYENQGLLWRYIIRNTLRRVDRLIVEAERLKSVFNGLAHRDKLSVLYNGLDFESETDEKKSFREPGPFTILFMGHIAFSKGFYELAIAFLSLRKTYPVRLIFAGTKRFSRAKRKSVAGFLSGDALKIFTQDARVIENTIRRLVDDGEKDDAHYLGIISGEEKQKAFADADVFVLPSYTEGFSMAVLEAMSYGLPVVVTRVGAFPEIIEDGVNGRFVSPGDSEDLKENWRN